MTSVKVTDNSQAFKDAKDRAVAAALEAIGQEAAGNAIEELTNQDAVDTGRLRNSIAFATEHHMDGHDFSWHEGRNGEPAGSDTTTPKAKPEKGTVYIGTNVEYAKYIEAGTSKAAARPFLRPAAQNHGEEYKKIMKDILKNA